MLSHQRRWIREPVSSVTSCLGRLLCLRRSSLLMLLVLLLISIAIQNFIARRIMNDNSSQLKLINKKQLLFKSLQNILKGLDPASSPAAQPDQKSSPTNRNPYNKHEEHKTSQGFILLGQVDKLVNPSEGSRKTNIRELSSPKRENMLNLGLSGSLFPQSTRTGLPADTDQRHVHNQAGPLQNLQELNCSPQSHIVFLKTHKTASSTILNILYRYGDDRNLTFALPAKKRMQLFYPYFFAKHFVEGVSSQTVKEFHIMCNHMRFRKSEVAKVMPMDTFYFSILRHPVAMMESLFGYYRRQKVFRKTSSLEDFFKSIQGNAKSSYFAHNTLAFDFGFHNDVTGDAEDFEERATMAIETIEQEFNLILIAEYFDESMILLRHSLCWSLEDVVSFKLNSRSEKNRQSVSPNTIEKIKWWNALDLRIYLHFNTTFREKVNSLIGEEQMKREVNALRKLQARLANTCLKDGGPVEPSKIKDPEIRPYQSGGAQIQGYNLNPLLNLQTKARCKKLITPELQYTKQLNRKQFPQQTNK